MAQHASEPLTSVALEEFSTSVPPTAAASPSFHAFHFQVCDDPPCAMEEPRVIVGLEPITDSVAVTATRAPDIPPPAPSLGFPVLGTQLAVATSSVGSVPLGSYVFVPPSVAIPLHPNSSVNESSAMRAQHLWATT